MTRSRRWRDTLIMQIAKDAGTMPASFLGLLSLIFLLISYLDLRNHSQRVPKEFGKGCRIQVEAVPKRRK